MSRSVDPLIIANKFKNGKGYKLQEKLKNIELPLIHTVTFSANIEWSLLKNLIIITAVKDVKEDATDKSLMHKVIEESFKRMISNESGEAVPVQLQEAMKGCRFFSHNLDGPAKNYNFSY